MIMDFNHSVDTGQRHADRSATTAFWFQPLFKVAWSTGACVTVYHSLTTLKLQIRILVGSRHLSQYTLVGETFALPSKLLYRVTKAVPFDNGCMQSVIIWRTGIGKMAK